MEFIETELWQSDRLEFESPIGHCNCNGVQVFEVKTNA